MAIGIELFNSGKKWTDEERIKLYKLVELKEKRWTEIAKEFDGVSDSACRNKYNTTNWELIFRRNGTNETKVIKDTLNEIDAVQSVVATSEKTSKMSDEEIVMSLEKEKEQALVDLEKHKIIQRSNDRLRKELVERTAITDLIIEKIEGAVLKVPAIEPANIKYPETSSRRTPEEACLVLSDLHVGLACIPEEVGNIGNYNKNIFIKRLNNLINSVKKITEIHRNSYKIDTLNIFALGDFVHGSNDAGQWGFLNTEQNIVDQILTIVSEISRSILTLNKIFKNINFYGVVGNHGRVSKRGVEKMFVNWDYLCYKYIELALANNKNVKFTIPRTPFCEVDVLSNKFLLVHGDSIKSWGGLPVYGMVRAEGRYQNLMQKTKSIDDLVRKIKSYGMDNNSSVEDLSKIAFNYSKPLDYIVMGHHHQSAEIEANGGGRVILNPSFVGGDDYTINQLLTSGEPSQKFFGVHPEGRTWQYEIDLERE